MKFGIIGYGRMGKIYHEVLKELKIEVAFVADLIRPSYEISNFFQDYKQALDSVLVDGIIVSTTSPSHYEIIKYAVEKKIQYIACEKAFTTSVKHAEELSHLVSSTDTRLIVNYSRRFSTQYNSLKKNILDQNLIGKPKSIIVTSGAGGLSALGTHFFDFCTFILAGKVKSVYAVPVDKNLLNPRGSEFKDPGGYVLLTFDNETRAFIDIGDDLGVQFIIEVICEFGRIIINELNKTITVQARTKEDMSKPRHLYVLPNPILSHEPFELETKNIWIKKMIENLISTDEIIVPSSIAKDKVEIYSAIRKSFDTKKIVYLPLDDLYYSKEFMVT